MKTVQRLTSQVQELQEGMNYLNDSGEFHEVESNNSGFLHTFQVNQQRFQVLDLCWAAANACNLKHGIHLDDRKTFLQSTFDVRVITNTLSRDSSIDDIKCCRSGSRANQHRETCGKRMKE